MTVYAIDDATPKTPGPGKFWIAPNAIVIGHVTIEEDASIWWNAVLRGDLDGIVIGRGSNVQDGAVLHTDPGFTLSLGPQSTIGHMAMVHGCTIGRGCLIGIGAIILNGATIGEESLVGAGAFVPEGKNFPARSLIIGSPARVARQLTDQDIAKIQRGVTGYQQRWRRYVAGLKAVG